MKIMVVDDVGFMRHLVQRLLENQGHFVLLASSANDGLNLLKNDTTIDAIICDLLMPDMDGIEFFLRADILQRFNDEGPVPAPPCILMTALRPNDTSRKRDVERLRKASEMGFADVMLKPIDQKHLVRTLAKIESKLRDNHAAKEGGSHDTPRIDGTDSAEVTTKKATLNALENEVAELKRKLEAAERGSS